MRHGVPRGGGGLRPAALVGVLVALWLGVAASVAVAHTELKRTSADARSVTLFFSKPASARLTEVDVLAATGGKVEPGPPRNAAGDPTTITVPIRGALRSGRYFVMWSTANDDGHVVSGAFDFRVSGSPAAGARRYRTYPAIPSSPAAVEGALSLARIAQDAALTIAFGLVVFLRAVWRQVPAAARTGSPRDRGGTGAATAAVRSAVDPRLRTLLVAAAVVGAGTAAAAPLLQSAVLVRGVPWDGATWAALPDVLALRAGACWAVVALLWLGVVAAARRRPDGAIVVGLAALLIVSPPLRGHAGDGPLGAAIVVHVAAAGAWIGGLVALLVVAHAAGVALSPRERLAHLAPVVSRFAVIALPCAVAVLGTGILQAIGSLDGLEQLTTESYGRLVAVKVALFTGIVAFAARGRRSLVARLWKPDGARAAAAMRTTIVMELMLAGTALMAAARLASTAPPG